MWVQKGFVKEGVKPDSSLTSFPTCDLRGSLSYLWANLICPCGIFYNIPLVNVLKRTSSSYVQDMIENMVLTSYLDKSYFVAS